MSELTLEFSNTRGGSGTQQDPFIATHGIITVLRGTGLNHRSTIPRTSGYDKSAFSPDERWGSTDRHGVGSHTYTIDWPKLIGPTPVTFTQWVAHPVNGWKKVERKAWFAPETEGDPL
ncbi:MAG TPA: hypothetical protein VLV83_11145, partial [Acidobacteriota bacterium]|nr:hypothetical protein [Acidobacteriota bacterium]